MDTRDAGRKGGISKSPRKVKTARENGAKGGRPAREGRLTGNNGMGRNQEFVALRTNGQKCRICKEVKDLVQFYDIGSRRCKPCDDTRRKERLKRAQLK